MGALAHQHLPPHRPPRGEVIEVFRECERSPWGLLNVVDMATWCVASRNNAIMKGLVYQSG